MDKIVDKYKVQTKEELRKIIEDGKIDLSTIDVSNVTDMSRIFS
jgi:hypothetical protein